MRITDILSLSSKNLLRSKLRTFLTVSAVVIGSFTLSLTNGVGNGVKAYIDHQLGNVAPAGTLLVGPKEAGPNFTSDKVVKYDPNKHTTQFLTNSDQQKIATISGVQKATSLKDITIEYISNNKDKYVAQAQSFISGLKIQMAAGNLLTNTESNSITIPEKYVNPLGFSSDQNAVGREITIGFKDLQGKIHEKSVTIIGVQQKSLLGSNSIYMPPPLVDEIFTQQTNGIASLSNQYAAVVVQYDPNSSVTQVDAIKKHIDDLGLSARSLQDQLGQVSQVISTIQIGLDVFGLIALLAAGFGIVNTLLMAVNERTREIGLMKALGASRRTIFIMFTAEALSLGFWGAIIGILLSIGVGELVNSIATRTFLKGFPGFNLLAFPITSSIEILIIILILSFAAGALPALKASKLDPIEALRYE